MFCCDFPKFGKVNVHGKNGKFKIWLKVKLAQVE